MFFVKLVMGPSEKFINFIKFFKDCNFNNEYEFREHLQNCLQIKAGVQSDD